MSSSHQPGLVVRQPACGKGLEDSKGVRITSANLLGGSGAVTQLTSNATAVTLNAHSGRITMYEALANGAGAGFTLTNSAINATCQIYLNVVGTTATAAATRDAFTYNITSQTSGSCVIQVYNGDAAASSAALVVCFFIVGGTPLG